MGQGAGQSGRRDYPWSDAGQTHTRAAGPPGPKPDARETGPDHSTRVTPIRTATSPLPACRAPHVQGMPDELRIGDADLMNITGGDQARARSLRKALQKLADDRAPDDPLHEAARVPAYAEALGDRMVQGFREYDSLAPAEIEQERSAQGAS